MVKAKSSRSTAKAASPMAHPLYLTADERKLFDALPTSLTKGWKTEEEKWQFQDSREKMQARMRNLHLNHPALKQLQRKAKVEKYSPEEILDMANTIDLSGLTESDILELAFAWGPGVFTDMIHAALNNAFAVDSIDDLAHLTCIRHGLLEAVNR